MYSYVFYFQKKMKGINPLWGYKIDGAKYEIRGSLESVGLSASDKPIM